MLRKLEGTINGRRRVYLARHGSVSYFAADGRPHRPETVSLDASGVLQAEELGRALRTTEIDRFVASDLLRAVSTAERIRGERAREIEQYPELREITAGRLADIPDAERERTFVDAFSATSRETRFLGGESFGEFADRVLRCYRSLVADTTWRSLCIVAHGGVNRIILCDALGLGLEAMGRFEQDPACLNILDVEPSGAAIVRLVNFSPWSPVKDGIHLTTMEAIYLSSLGERATLDPAALRALSRDPEPRPSDSRKR